MEPPAVYAGQRLPDLLQPGVNERRGADHDVVPLAVGFGRVRDRGERLDGLAQAHVVAKQAPARGHRELRAELLVRTELQTKTRGVQHDRLDPVQQDRRRTSWPARGAGCPAPRRIPRDSSCSSEASSDAELAAPLAGDGRVGFRCGLLRPAEPGQQFLQAVGGLRGEPGLADLQVPQTGPGPCVTPG